MSEEYAIEAQELTKRYDGSTVVDHLNLHVKENEVFGLLGPNGAGKTTTILMLLGLTEPVSGNVRVCGFNPTREPLKVKRLAGYLPEKVGFYDNLTARENLRFVAELNSIGYKEANSRIDELLGMVGLDDKGDVAVSKFSRGMKQRLGTGHYCRPAQEWNHRDTVLSPTLSGAESLQQCRDTRQRDAGYRGVHR